MYHLSVINPICVCVYKVIFMNANTLLNIQFKKINFLMNYKNKIKKYTLVNKNYIYKDSIQTLNI